VLDFINYRFWFESIWSSNKKIIKEIRKVEKKKKKRNKNK
jgi:hypothetical protein